MKYQSFTLDLLSSAHLRLLNHTISLITPIFLLCTYSKVCQYCLFYVKTARG